MPQRKSAASIRTLIIDDEQLARKAVHILLREDPEIEIAGECVNGTSAVESINTLKPDLIFLDVQMPDISGFDVLKNLNGDNLPLVVFVTAFDNYAIEAFKIHAVEYLLKPFNDARFYEALRHAKECYRQKKLADAEKRVRSLLDDLGDLGVKVSDQDQSFLSRLGIKSSGSTIFLDVKDVDWLEADHNYVVVHTGQKKHLMRHSINLLETKLDPKLFVRIHRSAIVNIDRIHELQSFTQLDYVVKLRDGTILRVSRSYLHRLKEVLNYSAG